MLTLKPPGRSAILMSLSSQLKPPSVDLSSISPPGLLHATNTSPSAPTQGIAPRTVLSAYVHSVPGVLLIRIRSLQVSPPLLENEKIILDAESPEKIDAPSSLNFSC